MGLSGIEVMVGLGGMPQQGWAGDVGELAVVGVSHASVPLSVLEAVAVHPAALPAALDDVLRAGCGEAVLLSTCGRTELYARWPHGDTSALHDLLLAPAGPRARGLRSQVDERRGWRAIAHLFRVTAGLESRVAGEVEIQAQVRTAVRVAEARGALGPSLRNVFDVAVATARRAHRETQLSSLNRSIGRSGIDLALEGHDASAARVGLVGTGVMAGVAHERLAELGVAPMVFGRSLDRAERLAGGAALARGVSELPDALEDLDVLVCATSARCHLIGASQVGATLARRVGRRLTLLDLGVPRNVDPAAGAIAGVRLIDLSELGDGQRSCAVAELDPVLERASTIVASAVEAMVERHRRRAVGPVLAQLQAEAEQRCRLVLAAARPELVADGSLGRVARSRSRRLIHRCLREVLDAVEHDEPEGIRRILDRIDWLSDGDPPSGARSTGEGDQARRCAGVGDHRGS